MSAIAFVHTHTHAFNTLKLLHTFMFSVIRSHVQYTQDTVKTTYAYH